MRTDKFDPLARFELQESDGERCYQVLVFNEDDLKYWTDEAKKKGYLIAFDCHRPKNWAGYSNPTHDVYQIFPPEVARMRRLRLRQQIESAMIKTGETDCRKLVSEPFEQEIARIFASQKDTNFWIDVIVLTDIPLYDSFWIAKYKDKRYAVISKDIFESEIKPKLTLETLETNKGNQLFVNNFVLPDFGLGIPVVEDDELAQEILTEILRRAMDNADKRVIPSNKLNVERIGDES